MPDTLDALPATKRARVEIIPLIDGIFFLLATFVLFTLSLERIRDLPIPVPKGGESREEPQTLILTASAEGLYFWQVGTANPPEQISRDEIRPRLDTYKQAVKVPRVIIRGDRTAKLGPALRALDEVRLAGIKQVVVETVAAKTAN